MKHYNLINEIEKVQESIRVLQENIKNTFEGKFKDEKRIIYETTITDANNAYDSLEQVEALCTLLSNAYTDIL